METFSELLALWGESTGWLKASDAERWCFPWSAPEQTVEQKIETPVISDAITFIMTSRNGQIYKYTSKEKDASSNVLQWPDPERGHRDKSRSNWCYSNMT